MNSIQIIIGIVNLVLGLLIILFRNSVSKSHAITVPGGFGGKSFKEKLGEDKGRKGIFLLGLFLIIAGLIFLITGLFGINLTN